MKMYTIKFAVAIMTIVDECIHLSVNGVYININEIPHYGNMTMPKISHVEQSTTKGVYRGVMPEKVVACMLFMRLGIFIVQTYGLGETPTGVVILAVFLLIEIIYPACYNMFSIYKYVCIPKNKKQYMNIVLYVYIYVYIYIHIFMYEYRYIYIYIHRYVYIYLHGYIYIYMYICIHICKWLCISYIYIYIYTYTFTYKYVYLYV